MSPSLLSSAEARDVLCARWPGRREQISQLLGYLGEPHDHAAPVFVHSTTLACCRRSVTDFFCLEELPVDRPIPESQSQAQM